MVDNANKTGNFLTLPKLQPLPPPPGLSPSSADLPTFRSADIYIPKGSPSLIKIHTGNNRKGAAQAKSSSIAPVPQPTPKKPSGAKRVYLLENFGKEANFDEDENGKNSPMVNKWMDRVRHYAGLSDADGKYSLVQALRGVSEALREFKFSSHVLKKKQLDVNMMTNLQSPDDFLLESHRYGDCRDYSHLMVATFEKLGFDAVVICDDGHAIPALLVPAGDNQGLAAIDLPDWGQPRTKKMILIPFDPTRAVPQRDFPHPHTQKEPYNLLEKQKIVATEAKLMLRPWFAFIVEPSGNLLWVGSPKDKLDEVVRIYFPPPRLCPPLANCGKRHWTVLK